MTTPQPGHVSYRRVSTHEQAASGAGLDAQQRKVEALATLHERELDDDYLDAGWSASTLDRPALNRLMRDVDAGAIASIYVAKLDRLTRSVRDLGLLIERFNARGVRLVSASESIDTGTAAGRLVLHVLASVSQWEREVIAERTRDALDSRRRQGRVYNGVAPFGQMAQDGMLRPNPDEQAVIATARSNKALGMSLRKNAAALTAAGHRTRRSGPWTAQGVHKSLLK